MRAHAHTHARAHTLTHTHTDTHTHTHARTHTAQDILKQTKMGGGGLHRGQFHPYTFQFCGRTVFAQSCVTFCLFVFLKDE